MSHFDQKPNYPFTLGVAALAFLGAILGTIFVR